MGQPPTDSPLLDSSEQVYISSLALLKMLKHGAPAISPSLFPPHPAETKG
jgi:26S proteasome regulatory subunit N11